MLYAGFTCGEGRRRLTYVTNLERGSSEKLGWVVVHTRKTQTFGLVFFIKENGILLGKYIYVTAASIECVFKSKRFTSFETISEMQVRTRTQGSWPVLSPLLVLWFSLT